MKGFSMNLTALLLIQATCVAGFVASKNEKGIHVLGKPRPIGALSPKTLVRAAASASSEIPTYAQEKKKTLKDFRKEGGILTFNTPIGALNPYAIYYGLTSLFLGIPWYIALKTCQFLYWITGGRFDKKVRKSWVCCIVPLSVCVSNSCRAFRDAYQSLSVTSGVWL
jgi:hypothetical protein